MKTLELLAPARNADIGIAAIDCGADAVYIAGPDFGARKAAGNEMEDISRLCLHAHKFGAKVFLTVNVSIDGDDMRKAHDQMLLAQDAGVDAFIIREPLIATWDDIKRPLHASTQCAIRSASDARRYENLGCERIILERQLSLEEIKEIRRAVSCEIECFVHGALCVGYSGECRLSEYIDGRSADRGECIQACRSLYDLVDEHGKVLVKNKALLSLKDFNLKSRLADLAEEGVCSFKIEGRLKNASYVKNVVRDYSIALDTFVSAHSGEYRRLSFGKTVADFTPDCNKTFNRGYTQLFFDGKRDDGWASMDAPKSMGEMIGTIASVKDIGHGDMEICLVPAGKRTELHNGDGFAFVSKNAIEGFRGDVCEGRKIICKKASGIHKGTTLFRNISTAFEKELEKPCRREVDVDISIKARGGSDIEIRAVSEDGRKVVCPFNTDVPAADNTAREEALLRDGLSKRTDHYRCKVVSFESSGPLPLLSSSIINSMRRAVISDLDSIPANGAADKSRTVPEKDDIPETRSRDYLMRSRYCIRFELGMCPVHQHASGSDKLFLVNNGRRLRLHFDCKSCEMSITAVQK